MNIKRAERVTAYVPPRADDIAKLAVKLNKVLGTEDITIAREDCEAGPRWVLMQQGRRLSMPYTEAEMTICVAAYVAGYEMATL